jgi:hypothetical protein
MGRPVKSKKLETTEKGGEPVVVERKKPRYHPGTVSAVPGTPGSQSGYRDPV